MVDFKRLDAADNGEQEDTDTEQQSSEFADLYTESLKERPEKDKIIEGTVARIDQETVLVDIGLKSEGHVAASEFRDANGDSNGLFATRAGSAITHLQVVGAYTDIRPCCIGDGEFPPSD